jgi:drug/metabolite transporter (DMT)-like permease
LALKSGAMIAIGPVQYATNIIYPVCASLLVFRQTIQPGQGVGVAIIVFAVVVILKKHE